MKSMLFLWLITVCPFVQAIHYKQIVDAIVESDYVFLADNQKNIIVTYQEKEQLIKINNDVISMRQAWMVEHAGRPHIGSDLFLSLGALLISTASIIFCASLSSAHIEGINDTSINQCICAGISIISGIYATKKYADAFLKPKRLLQNALFIKALLYSL